MAVLASSKAAIHPSKTSITTCNASIRLPNTSTKLTFINKTKCQFCSAAEVKLCKYNYIFLSRWMILHSKTPWYVPRGE